MSNMPATLPLIVFAIGVGLLTLEIVFIVLVHHGADWRERLREHRRRSTMPGIGQQRLGGSSASRTVKRDDAHPDDRRAAHGLVDRSGLRRIPGDHPRYVGRVRRSRSGARSRAHVWPFSRVASHHGQDLGREPAASRPVGHPAPPSSLDLVNTAQELYSQSSNTAWTLYSGRVSAVGGGDVL